jgi:hypothetical protein
VLARLATGTLVAVCALVFLAVICVGLGVGFIGLVAYKRRDACDDDDY